jgi:ketosteroid isomerase-like protein
MRSLLRLAFALTCLALAGCEQLSLMTGPSSTAPIAYGPETEKQIERSSKRYASLLQAMDADGLSRMYSPDGVWERQNGPVEGREAIRQALANTNGVQVQAVEMTTSYMSYNGPAIVQTGDFSQTVKLPNGKVVTATGRFEATWIRSASGEWWIKRMVTRPNATKPN